jgi:NAD(P)-dependent dehydrogenase (short-subunit alcohol dehydrogenase family)
MEKLSGKTALVTGSTDGVGRLVACKLGQAGTACWCMAAMPREALASSPRLRPMAVRRRPSRLHSRANLPSAARSALVVDRSL